MATDDKLSNIIKEGSATCISDSKLYVFGGLVQAEKICDVAGGSSDPEMPVIPSVSLFECNVRKEEVTKLSPLDQSNAFCTLTKVGSKLYAIFGFHPERGWSEDVFMYDTDTDAWEMLDLDEDADELPGPRDKHCAVAVGEKVYIFGGFGPMDDEEDLDESPKPVLGTLEEEEEGNEESSTNSIGEGPQSTGGEKEADATNSTDKSETNASETGNSTDKGPQTSGGPSGDNNHAEDDEEDEDEEKGPSASFSWFNDTWIMKEENGVAFWSQPLFTTSARPTPRAASSLTLDERRNRLINFGGRDYTGRRNDVNIYDIAARKWLLDVADGGTIPSERSYHAACVHNDRLIVCGGRNSEDQELNDIFMLDLGSLMFEQISLSNDLTFQPRCGHIISVVADDLIILGGVSGYQPETMMCEKRVEEIKAIPWASLISHEVEEPVKKKPRVSDGSEAEGSEVKS